MGRQSKQKHDACMSIHLMVKCILRDSREWKEAQFFPYVWLLTDSQMHKRTKS